MPILYSQVVRGTTVLAKHADIEDDFQEIIKTILAKSRPPNPNSLCSRLSCTHGPYLFHYVYERSIYYMCITDHEFERGQAFQFLDEIKGKFQSYYGSSVISAIDYPLNAEFDKVLAREMKIYSKYHDWDTISKFHSELDALKDTMPILYSVVSRGTTVLAKHASCAGNFQEVTERILANIPPQNDKLTYSHGQYFFHYVCENGIIYMCITDNEFERSRAFLFLNEIKRRFQANYGSSAASAIAYSLNAEFARVLANEMKHYSESHDVDTISKVHSELDELKDIMVKNIDNVVKRGEQLEVLVEKTDLLNSGSVSFRTTSRNLARSMFWKNIKLYVIIGVVIIVIVYFIISMACGGLLWKGCVAK